MSPSNRATHEGIIGLVVDETQPRATHKGIIGLVVDETRPLRTLDGSRGAAAGSRAPAVPSQREENADRELAGRAS